MVEKAPDAIFDIPGPSDDGELIFAEGLEDALSLWRWSRRDGASRKWRVIGGLPGLGALRHMKVAKDRIVTMVRDGDVPGSPAGLALIDGVDRLLLQGANVYVTSTPQGEDANSILLKGGVDALTALVDGVQPAELSRNGRLLWLASLDRIDYEAARKTWSNKLGIRVAILDQEVERRRRETPPEDDDNVVDDGLLDEDIDLAGVLDAILAELKRYVVAPGSVLGTAALWAAHTHLVHHPKVHLKVSPRLAIQAVSAGCGKTVLLEIVGCLAFEPRPAASITASSLFRIIDTERVTFLVDEADQLLHSRHTHPDLLAMMNASHRRASAYIYRSIFDPGTNAWVPQRFCVWTAMALAGIGELPIQQQERSVVITLPKALARDVPDSPGGWHQCEDRGAAEAAADLGRPPRRR